MREDTSPTVHTTPYPADLDEKFRLGLEYHQRDLHSIQVMDNKGVALLALSSLILSLAVTGKVGLGIWHLPAHPWLTTLLMVGGVLSFLFSASCSIKALWLRDFFDGPSIQALLEDYWDAEGDDLKYNILYWAYNWERKNDACLKSKGKWLLGAMIFTVIEVLFLVAWLALS